MKKTKPVRLSSRWLGTWKYFLFGLYLVLIGLLFIFLFKTADGAGGYVVAVGQAVVNLYFFRHALIVMARLQNLSFDSDFAIVQMKGQELLIPLENIKDVELVSLAGTYRVTLYQPEQLGDTFYFKVSLLYPLNHRRKEALIDRFWAAIRRAKLKKQEFPRHALPS